MSSRVTCPHCNSKLGIEKIVVTMVKKYQMVHGMRCVKCGKMLEVRYDAEHDTIHGVTSEMTDRINARRAAKEAEKDGIEKS